MPTPDLSDEQEREVERLIALANVQRLRGQFAEAEDSCRKALDITPEDVTVRELLADILHENGKLEAARSEYRKAMELSPGKVSLETKYAKVSIEIAEIEREKAIAQDMLEHPQKYMVVERRPWLAFLVGLVPGLGQIYNHEFFKGGLIFGVFLLFVIVVGFVAGSYRGVRDIGMLLANTHPFVLVLGLVTTFLWVYGMIDALVVASRLNRTDKFET